MIALYDQIRTIYSFLHTTTPYVTERHVALFTRRDLVTYLRHVIKTEPCIRVLFFKKILRNGLKRQTCVADDFKHKT